ncbi:MAG: phosphatase PAP2 family protein, partial [Thermoleophilia bacterium]|nr:phosphatase PAP2 family protein [Thermoleophilia bacterium]
TQDHIGALFEPAVQRAVDASSLLVVATSYTYWLSQFAVVGLALLWVYFRHHDRFASFRNWLILANLVGLLVYVAFPVAPPRMFPEWGFVDTLAQYSSINHSSGLIAFAANPYAAMPSLHAMDALIVGIVMAGLVRSRVVKGLWLAWPAWVAFAVIATGNHYWLDVVAGFALAGVTALALRRAPLPRFLRA